MDCQSELLRLKAENETLRLQVNELKEKVAEAPLQRLQLQLLFENSPMLINVMNSDLEYILWNKECERLLGYSAQEIIGNPKAAELIYPDPDYRNEVRASLSEAGYDYAPRLRRMTAKDGSVKLVNWYNVSRLCPIPGWHIWGQGIDVTELSNQQRDLSTLLENSPDAIVRVDCDLRFIYVNKTFSQLARIEQNDFIGHTAPELGLPAYFYHFWDHHNRQLLKTKQGYSLEGAAFDLNGQLYYYSGQGVPEFDHKGRIQSILCISRNITRQKKLEIALRRQQQEFAALVENAPDIIARLDRSGRCIYANPATEKLTGLAQSSFWGKRISELRVFSDIFVKHFVQNFAQVIASHQQCRFEHEYIANGELHYMDNQLIPEFAPDGRLESVLFLSRDITPYRQMALQLARLDRLNLVGEMAASIGHEVRNPMTTVRGFLQLLGNKPEYERHSEFFRLMIEELDRANSIISEFLSLAKDKTVNLEIQDLNGILTALQPLLKANSLIDNKSFSMELNDLPPLNLDEKEIRQLVLNLVRNGLEAMSPGQSLKIKTLRKKDRVVLSVSDQGHGIPEDILKHLGTPFVSTKDQGTGLGLAVCYSIANRHNALIKVKTSSKGTTFLISFPIP